MSSASWIVLALAGVVAVADWVAVWRRPSAAENVLKPLVLILLIAVALMIDPEVDAQRAWFVVALTLSLAGDVLLLPAIDAFVPGLASFLLAHLAFVAGFIAGHEREGSLAGVVIYLALLFPFQAWRIVGGVRRTDRALVGPVIGYMVVIAAMLVAAYWHGDGVGIAGAVLFVISDTLLAADRFVRPQRWGPTAVMMTYHTAQAVLVLSIASKPT